MSENPLFLQSTATDTFEYPAADWRFLLGQFFTEGVLNLTGGHLLVTVGTGMAVSVAAGAASIQGDASPTQGHYLARWSGATSVTVPAASVSNPRIDLVVARIRDAQADGGTQSGKYIEVIPGTPASSPVAPALPAHATELARITVPTSASSLTSGNITDTRTQAAQATVGLRAAEIRVFAASGTWTKPATMRAALVITIGGGGGGGVVTVGGTTGYIACGGSGGGRAERVMTSTMLGATESVVVGAGGAGASAAANAANGALSGSDGGYSSFGTVVYASGGQGGIGNASANTSKPNPGQPFLTNARPDVTGTAAHEGRGGSSAYMSGGVASGTTGSAAAAAAILDPNTDSDTLFGASAGGSSGGQSSAQWNATRGGLNGKLSVSQATLGNGLRPNSERAAGGFADNVTGGSAIGGPGISRGGTGNAGDGGGAAYSRNTSSGVTATGGAGGLPGGGGGGAAASAAQTLPVSGGAGARGEVIVIEFY